MLTWLFSRFKAALTDVFIFIMGQMTMSNAKGITFSDEHTIR